MRKRITFPFAWVAGVPLLRSTVAAPTGYRLMLKRQGEGAAMSDPVLVEAGVQMFAAACPDEPPRTWQILRSALEDGFRNIDRRLAESGELQPERFCVAESNARLSDPLWWRGGL